MHIRDSSGIFGAERVVLTIAKNIDRDRFDLKLLCLKRADGRSDKLIGQARDLGINVKTVDLNGRFNLDAIGKIRTILVENKIHLLHSHDFKCDFYSFLASIGTGIRRITTAHGSTRDSFLKKCYLFCDEQIIYRGFDRIIAVSEDLRRVFNKKGIPDSKISVIQNGLDFELLKNGKSSDAPLDIPSEKTVFAVIGRLYPDKGHKYFLNAIRNVIKKHPNTFAIIVGDGPSRNDIRHQIQHLDLEKHVRLCGVRSDMQSVYDRIDSLVVPSLTEGLPYVLLEAMANNVPIIATSVGDIPVLIQNDKSGRLVPPADVAAMTKSMEDLLEESVHTALMVQKANEIVFKRFSAERMVREIEDLYLELL